MNLSRRTLLSASALLVASPRVLLSAPPGAAKTTVAGATDLILCWNENPYGPGPAARAALAGAVSSACRYPEAEITTLTDALMAKESMLADNIVIGTGSGELLTALGYLMGKEGGEIISADPTYLELIDYAKHAGALIKTVPVDAKMCHDLSAMRAAVGAKTRAVYLCNPNNPTGTAVSADAIRSFVDSLPEHVTTIVDEAYLDFADDPAVATVTDLVSKGRRVVVLRTFSKIHGMAGVRCGYAITRPDIAADLAAARMTSPNMFAMKAARASLGDRAFLTDCRQRIIASRKRILRVLGELGLALAEPHGNFVFFDTGMPLEDFTQRMLERHIRVGRRFRPFDDWCRITIGTEPQVDTFLTALRAIKAESSRPARRAG